MNNRKLLSDLINGKTGPDQLKDRQPPTNATLNVIAPEGYQPQPSDPVTTDGGELMTVAEWENLNTFTTSPARLSLTVVSGAVFIKPTNQ